MSQSRETARRKSAGSKGTDVETSFGARLDTLSKRIEKLEDRIDGIEGDLEETDRYARGGAGKAVDLEDRLDSLEGELVRRGLIPRD